MATQVITNSGHDDMIHDAVLDYYGRRLATCSSDKTIKIFDVEGESHRLSETLKGHDGAVWSISWAHPKYGTLLASSSYSGQILIHREVAPGNWQLIQSSTTHSASVNIVAWAPHEAGCVLAAASSDGSVSLLELAGAASAATVVPGQLAQAAFVQIAHFPAHSLGANAVSWAPAQAPGSLTSSATQTAPVTKRFATGGSDCAVKIWEVQGSGPQVEPVLVQQLDGHTNWVRDVSWSSTVLRKSYIASASQDRTVRIWTSENGVDWTSTALPTFDAVAWRVSWSLSGNVLAVSTGDNKVTLWKEKLSGGWESVKTIDEST